MGFLNIAFLVGLVAAAVPIVIHLLNRRRVKRVKFSSLEFLDEVNKQRMRRINLRRILILILRTLAVLAVVFAFARPTLRSGLLFAGSVPKNVVVCLDASFSMGVAMETGTAFDAAKAIAGDIVDEAGNSDAVNVVVFGKQAESLLEQGTRNKGVVRSAIDRVVLSNETTSIRAGVDRALELIEKSDVEGGEVFVVSDFRASDDSSFVDEAALPENVRVYFIPVYDEDIDNVSIDKIGVPRKLLRPGEVVRVSVTATNHARRTPASVPLEVVVEGDRKAEQVLELAPGTTETVAFPLSLAEPGHYHGRVAKHRDRLPVDDDRFFLIEVSNTIPVTVMTGRRRAATSETPAQVPSVFYVEKALNPRGTSEGEFSVRVIDERDATASAFPTGSVVVWVDPQNLEPKRMLLLERHVRRGGGLLVFLGNADAAILNDSAFRALAGFRGGTEKSGESRAAFTSFEKGHPVFSLFTKEELELLSRAKVRAYVSARGVAPDSALAYIGGGDPAVWECERGRGRVLVFAAAPDLASSDIPLSPMFLPLVHTSVSYLASSGEAPGADEHLVGSPISFTVSQTNLDESQLTIRDPAAESLKPSIGERSAGDVQVGFDRPARPGFYQLYRDTTRVAETAVNVDARESNVATSSLAEKRPKSVSVVRAGESFRTELREAKEGREVFAAFLLIAVAALAAESVLGRRA